MRYGNILLIDDDAEDRFMFSIAVKEVGSAITFTATDNAKEALASIRAGELTPDVIFVDLNMPVMNGQEFLVEMKMDSKLHTIPVIIFTTSSHGPTIQLMKEQGATDFITKPDTFDELVNILQSLLNGTMKQGQFRKMRLGLLA